MCEPPRKNGCGTGTRSCHICLLLNTIWWNHVLGFISLSVTLSARTAGRKTIKHLLFFFFCCHGYQRLMLVISIDKSVSCTHYGYIARLVAYYLFVLYFTPCQKDSGCVSLSFHVRPPRSQCDRLASPRSEQEFDRQSPAREDAIEKGGHGLFCGCSRFLLMLLYCVFSPRSWGQQI